MNSPRIMGLWILSILTLEYIFFSFIPSGLAYSSLIIQCVHNIMGVRTTDELAAAMNRRFQVRQSTPFNLSYLDCGSGILHDTVLRKFSNAFCGNSCLNLLSSNSRTSKSHKAGLARHMDDCKENYKSHKYMVAWQNVMVSKPIAYLEKMGRMSSLSEELTVPRILNDA